MANLQRMNVKKIISLLEYCKQTYEKLQLQVLPSFVDFPFYENSYIIL